jgi:NADH dehydrogenase [ubiquinone] 1 alpha subcomplex assembly factor 2
MKVLAAQADARWAARSSLTDSPDAAAHNEQSLLGSQGATAGSSEAKEASGEERPQAGEAQEQPSPAGQRQETWRKMQQQQLQPSASNPWEQRRGGPSEEWQPKQWQPPSPKKA